MTTTDKYKKEKRIYWGIILFLFLLIIVLVWQFITLKTGVDVIIAEKEKTISRNYELKTELEELMAEHEKIKQEYGELSSLLEDKDSLIIAQAEEIEALILAQADHRRIKRQLDRLRSITQGYLTQIDSLYQINQELIAENIEIKQTLKIEKGRVFELSKAQEELKEQITTAAVLRAYNVNAVPLSISGQRDKETETDRARRTDAIRICFTLGENTLIPIGTKDIYIRIARPDNLILTQGSYSFIYQGDRIHFSEKAVVKYNQKAQNVCITYRRGDVELMSGSYHINLFADDNMIGEAAFVLR